MGKRIYFDTLPVSPLKAQKAPARRGRPRTILTDQVISSIAKKPGTWRLVKENIEQTGSTAIRKQATAAGLKLEFVPQRREKSVSAAGKDQTRVWGDIYVTPIAK